MTPEQPDAQRDPRVDPRPGDVLRSRNGIVREITVVLWGPSVVRCIEFGREKNPNIKQWRKWAKEATVIKRGPE